MGVNTGLCYTRMRYGVFTGYSWGIHMYRLCIGYVSGMYRVRDGGNEERGGE